MLIFSNTNKIPDLEFHVHFTPQPSTQTQISAHTRAADRILDCISIKLSSDDGLLTFRPGLSGVRLTP